MSKIMREIYADARRARQVKDLALQPAPDPRRYSCNPDDAQGYANWLPLSNTGVRVYVDGVHIKRAIAADEALGIVIALEEPVRVINDETVKIELRGNVRVLAGAEVP